MQKHIDFCFGTMYHVTINLYLIRRAIMPRPNNDYTDFTYEGEYNWRDALLESKGSGILTVGLCEEMRLSEGHKRDTGNKASKTRITAIYDESYIRDYIHKKIVVALGFIKGDVMNADEFMNYMAQQVEYSSQESKRASEGGLIRDAQDLAKKHGGEVSHWIGILKQGLETKDKPKNTSENKSLNHTSTKDKAKAEVAIK